MRNQKNIKMFHIRYYLYLLIVIYCTCFINFCLADEQSKFKIGVIAPLSGPLAEYGLASKNGIEMAIEENPSLFSNIKFIYEDSQWDPKIAINAFFKLTKVDKVSIVYNWGNPTTEALAPIAEQSHIPLIALSLDPKVASNKNYIIRTINRAEDFSMKLANYLNEKKPKKISLVMADNTYVRDLSNGLRTFLNKEISIDEIGPFSITEQNFLTTIAKIKLKKYDYIGVFLI